MDMHQLSLEPLSLPELSGAPLVEAARHAGFDLVSFVLESPAPALPVDPIRHDAALRIQVRDAMRAAGLGMSNIECFNLTPDPDFASFAQALACGAELGARTGTAIIWENSDRADALTSFRRLCDMARDHNIAVNLEFISVSQSMSGMDQALAFVRESGRQNAGLMLDLLHVVRCGASMEAVATIPDELVTGVQICDGMLRVDQSALLAEAGGNRMDPGTGEFPLSTFIQSIPSHVAIGVEVPKVELIGTISPFARAVTLYQSARSIVGRRD